MDKELLPAQLPRFGPRLAATLSALVMAAAGASSAAQSRPDQWQVELTPYLWTTALKGTTQIGSTPTVNVDASFSDILDVIDFAFMGSLEARKGRLGLFFDGVYSKLSTSATASRTGPGPIGATATANVNLKLEQTIFTFAGMYRIAEGATPVDLVGGIRWVDTQVTADVNGSFFARPFAVSTGGEKDWVDPFIGLRVKHSLSPRWSLVGYADVGGFGVGSDSTYQVAAGVDYRFSDSVSGTFGYRQLKIDYNQDGIVYDMKYSGIYAGIGIRF